MHGRHNNYVIACTTKAKHYSSQIRSQFNLKPEFCKSLSVLTLIVRLSIMIHGSWWNERERESMREEKRERIYLVDRDLRSDAANTACAGPMLGEVILSASHFLPVVSCTQAL